MSELKRVWHEQEHELEMVSGSIHRKVNCTVYTKTRVDNVTVECCYLPQAITFHASAEVL